MEKIKALVCYPDGTEEWIEREKMEEKPHVLRPSTEERLEALEKAMLMVMEGNENV